ncbi:MAG: AAA family ATPase [Deltaproteobacteria bacterium]|jgi:CO dehydrogenase maturation factor|nr:AAA family ATPase [Deltaproteobacteria bacterium]
MAKSIAVAGKGGTGKSTTTALIISELVNRGMGPVLAVDADPDCNLGTLLGVPPKQTIGDLRDDLLKEIKNFPAGMTKANYIEMGLHEIIEEAEGFDLITMGKGEGASCYCFINSLIRKFCDDLAPSYKWLVIDNEAGLEHLSRRTTVDIDGLLVVVNENPLSFDCAVQIESIVKDMKDRIAYNFLITNLVKEERKAKVHERLAQLDMELLCDLPYNAKLEETIFLGEPIKKLIGDPVMDNINLIINRIGGENGNS